MDNQEPPKLKPLRAPTDPHIQSPFLPWDWVAYGDVSVGRHDCEEDGTGELVDGGGGQVRLAHSSPEDPVPVNCNTKAKMHHHWLTEMSLPFD